jgi:hypothetical protein
LKQERWTPKEIAGWLSQREARLLGMNDMAVNYLKTISEAAHTSVSQVINESVREEAAAAARGTRTSKAANE